MKKFIKKYISLIQGNSLLYEFVKTILSEALTKDAKYGIFTVEERATTIPEGSRSKCSEIGDILTENAEDEDIV